MTSSARPTKSVIDVIQTREQLESFARFTERYFPDKNNFFKKITFEWLVKYRDCIAHLWREDTLRPMVKAWEAHLLKLSRGYTVAYETHQSVTVHLCKELQDMANDAAEAWSYFDGLRMFEKDKKTLLAKRLEIDAHRWRKRWLSMRDGHN